jgi:hypothetical protein
LAIAFEKHVLGSGKELLARHGKGRETAYVRHEMRQGLKPDFFLEAFCGTTEVMPCYKALFDCACGAA